MLVSAAALSDVLSGADSHWGVIVMHAVLSFLSVGGPLWFAWLAMKQIGQRFRLAEDNAYKASVAKAYEGYKKQAAQFDNDFAERLFGAALTRLAEAPLGLIEKDPHGSPWHELISSKGFAKVMDNIPVFREKVIELAKAGIDAASSVASSAKKSKAKVGDDIETKEAAATRLKNWKVVIYIRTGIILSWCLIVALWSLASVAGKYVAKRQGTGRRWLCNATKIT